MRKLLLAATCIAVAGCQTGSAVAPLSQAQMQQNLNSALYFLQAGGCLASTLSAAAAPIVAIAADAKGNQVLSSVSATGASLCTVTVPPIAVPAPAPANAAPATITVPKTS